MAGFTQAKLLEIEGAHVYETPAGKRYPSITTIINRTESEADRLRLEQWRQDVGHDEAQRISERASAIGDLAHKMNENYLLGDVVGNNGGEHYPTAHQHHANFRPYIDRICKTYGAELRMYSDRHRMAGMADVVCRYDWRDTILDYKTKLKIQYEQDMSDYYIQTTAYAVMYEELTGHKMEQLVILCSIEGTDRVQEFRSEPGLWKDRLFARLESFDPKTVKMH